MTCSSDGKLLDEGAGAVMYLNMSAVLTYRLLPSYAFARTAVRPMFDVRTCQ
jgi:hypothetical protein